MARAKFLAFTSERFILDHFTAPGHLGAGTGLTLISGEINRVFGSLLTGTGRFGTLQVLTAPHYYSIARVHLEKFLLPQAVHPL